MSGIKADLIPAPVGPVGPLAEQLPHKAHMRQSGRRRGLLVPDSVMDYRFVRTYPAKTGVKSSQSGNSSQ
jgi:hypothetical protein